MTHRHRLRFFSVLVRRGVLAVGVSSVTGLGLWACVDVLEDAPPTAMEADERVRAARADAELERILVQVRDGDDDDRLAHDNRLGAGIANFGHGGSDVVFSDRREAEQLRVALTTDGTSAP